LFYGQRTIKSYKLRGAIKNLQSRLKGKLSIEDGSNFIKVENEMNFATQLSKNGFVELNNLVSNETQSEIKNFIADLP
jgi:hypothetical protein